MAILLAYRVVIERRLLLAAFAPNPSEGYTGRPLAASYDLRTRTTTIFFKRGEAERLGRFSHDTGLISRPVAAKIPEIKETVPPQIYLSPTSGWLEVYGLRGKFARLMRIPDLPIGIVYPRPSHPDMTVIWSLGDRIYYTNNDYKNVYLLPERMFGSEQKPQLTRQHK